MQWIIIILALQTVIIFYISCCVRRKQGKPQKTKYVVSPDAKPSSPSSSDMVPMAMLKKVEAENGVELNGEYENVACKLLSWSP